MRNGLSKDIQDNALKFGVDVKKMNQELRVGLEMKDALLRRLSQENANNLVGLQDIGVMGIFSGGHPITALSLGIGKKFLEGKAPNVAQGLYNLNKTPYAVPSVTRGNTISTGNSSSLFVSARDMGSSSASRVPGQVTPRPLLPTPSGKPTSAKEVNVKPIIVPPQGYKGDITSRSIVKDPRTIIKSPEGVKRTIVKPKEILRPVNGTPPLGKEAKTIVKPTKSIIKPPLVSQSKNIIKSKDTRPPVTSEKKSIFKKNPSNVESTKIDTANESQISSLYKTYKDSFSRKDTIIIDSDNIKTLFKDYNEKQPETTHTVSSKLEDIFYRRALKDMKGDTVVLNMGGGGSGKSEILTSTSIAGGAGLVLDGTGKNYAKLTRNIELAEKSGKKVQVHAVYIDYKTASKFNSKRSRNVPESHLYETHAGYRESLKKLIQEHPEVDIKFVVNTGKKGIHGRHITYDIGKEGITHFLNIVKDL